MSNQKITRAATRPTEAGYAVEVAEGASTAIDSMSDDELEAKIDSMLMVDDPPEAFEAPAAEEVEFDAATELERRVAAMIRVDTTKIDAQVERAKVEPVIAIETPWPDTTAPSKRKRSGWRVLLCASAAVAIVSVGGFLGHRQLTIAPAAPEVARPLPVAVEAPQEPVAEQVVTAEPEPQVEPPPVVPPKPPEFTPRSRAEVEAANARQRRAEEALLAAARSLQSGLLSQAVGEPPAGNDDPPRPVDIEANLIGTPVPPGARRGELFDIGEVDQAPRHRDFARPVYDELARRMRHQGEVVVSVLIDETGRVADARLIKEITRSRLNAATLEAAKRWTYDPAVKDGVQVKVWKTERIVFALD